MPGRLTKHSVAKPDLEQNGFKVTGRNEGKRPKSRGPLGAVGPFRHMSMQSFFNRTSSCVGPMVDNVSSIVAYQHSTTDTDKVSPKVKVKDEVNVKVVKQSNEDKSSAGGKFAVQLRSVSLTRHLLNVVA